ncbi:MAG: PKD domain-containing protein [Candidatus Electrothrix sp. AUS1_2]|nr:PKD domain-containing protein [Candidatus Electrothrix sp. AUS1_2]
MQSALKRATYQGHWLHKQKKLEDCMMKKWKLSTATAIFCSAFIFCSNASAGIATANANKPAKKLPELQPVENQVLVSFKHGASASEMAALHSKAKGKVVKKISRLGIELVEVPEGTVADAIKAYRKNAKVAFAEPNYRRTLTTTEGSLPDPYNVPNNFTEQWHLHNTGQGFGAVCTIDYFTFEYVCTAPAYSGVPDADIDAPEGWELTHGSPDIKIAVLDSGVDCDHPDLAGKCVEQINFADGCSNPYDYIGHGTHVASIAAAETDNSIGTAGVAWDASIGSLKVCAEVELLPGYYSADCRDGDLAEAIVYAADNGYQVINMSLAGLENSAAIEAAVNYAWNQGAVLVAGAGNDYGTTVHYPAGYDNVIAVAATDRYDDLSSFSTFGNDWVSVAAPGGSLSLDDGKGSIFAAVPALYCAGDPDCYDWKSGTSMSTPVVSGVAAMVWSYITDPTNAAVRDCIEISAQKSGALGQNFLAWTQYGKVNLHDALLCKSSDNDPPTALFNSTVTGLNVAFTDRSQDSDGSIVSWSWDFGDGETATQQNPSHSYAAGGTYSVKLTVSDDAGDAAEFTDEVVTAAEPNSPPTALFSSASTSLNVDFTDRSQDSDGSITSWNWDFGDGETSTEQNPTHVYAAAGVHSVKLTVTDDDGESAEFIDTVVTVAQVCADDADLDGVPDADDKCQDTPPNTFVNPNGCPTKSKKP